MAPDTPLQTYFTGTTPPKPGDILDGYRRRRWLRLAPSGNSYAVQTVTPAGTTPNGQPRWQVTLLRLREPRPRSRWRILGELFAAALLLGVAVAWPGQAEAHVIPWSHCAYPAWGVRVCAWPVLGSDAWGDRTVAGGGSIRYRNGYAGLSGLGVYLANGPQSVGPAFGVHPRRHTEPAVVIGRQTVVVTVVASGPWGTTTVRSWPVVVP
jgi:hypothetical protein